MTWSCSDCAVSASRGRRGFDLSLSSWCTGLCWRGMNGSCRSVDVGRVGWGGIGGRVVIWFGTRPGSRIWDCDYLSLNAPPLWAQSVTQLASFWFSLLVPIYIFPIYYFFNAQRLLFIYIKSLGLGQYFKVFERRLFCSPRLNLFDQKIQ